MPTEKNEKINIMVPDIRINSYSSLMVYNGMGSTKKWLDMSAIRINYGDKILSNHILTRNPGGIKKTLGNLFVNNSNFDLIFEIKNNNRLLITNNTSSSLIIRELDLISKN